MTGLCEDLPVASLADAVYALRRWELARLCPRKRPILEGDETFRLGKDWRGLQQARRGVDVYLHTFISKKSSNVS